ncbi:MAG TPA: pyrroline-5-carboxylate reductase, partial [Bdellovibrionales bacterium]|nr:pyrroline-5-carboxylate reductase [Bdellovibrionales bacterium]
MKLGVIGLGKMGEALVKGLHDQGAPRQYQVEATTRTPETAKEAQQRLGVKTHLDNKKLVENCDVLVLCVKPHQAQKVLEAVAPFLQERHTLISIVASVTTEQLSRWAGGKPAIIRPMPNTPCLIGEGMTVFAAGPGAKS